MHFLKKIKYITNNYIKKYEWQVQSFSKVQPRHIEGVCI
jgi:hypothetical protein